MEPTVQISTSVIAVLTAELVFSVVLPVVLAIVWIRREHTKVMPLLVGIVAFFIVGVVLEQLFHQLMLGVLTPVGDFIVSSPVTYALYAGLTAGIFEESAKYVVFRTALKDRGREQAVTFGIGFAGTECFLVLGISMISNLFIAATFNNLGLEEFLRVYAEGQREGVMDAINQINTIDVPTILMACFERVVTLVLQLELTVLVFAAVQQKRFRLYPLAAALHAILRFFATLYTTGALPWLFVLELLFLFYAIALFLPARKLYRELPAEEIAVDRFGRPI